MTTPRPAALSARRPLAVGLHAAPLSRVGRVPELQPSAPPRGNRMPATVAVGGTCPRHVDRNSARPSRSSCTRPYGRHDRRTGGCEDHRPAVARPAAALADQVPEWADGCQGGDRWGFVLRLHRAERARQVGVLSR